MANLEKIVDELSGLTVLEAAELAKLLEAKWGVSAAAAVAVASGPAVTTDGDILFGAYSQIFYALNADGDVQWQFPLNDLIDASPAIVGQTSRLEI